MTFMTYDIHDNTFCTFAIVNESTMSEENLTEGYSILEEIYMLICEPPYHNLDTLLEDKWAVSIKPCPSRDSTRIAKTYVLTVQR